MDGVAMDWSSQLQMRWHTFAYNYQWPNYVYLFDGWIARSAMTVPIVGYLILFNDSISEHLSFNKLASEDSLRFGLSSLVRLQFIYFGLIFLGLANILYRIRRPYVMRIGVDQITYVENALKHFTVSAYIDIHGRIRHEGHTTLHGKYYDSEYDGFLDAALGKRAKNGERDEATANWTVAKQMYEGLLRSMLIENFFRSAIRRRYALSLAIALSLLGYALLLIPSGDLFIKVMVVVLR